MRARSSSPSSSLLNGVFVAAEIALVTVRRSRIRQLGDEGDRARPPGRPAGRAAGSVPGRRSSSASRSSASSPPPSRAPASRTLADVLRDIPSLAASADLLALLVVTLVVSLVTIVFGELVPKTLALAHAERYALALARADGAAGQRPRAGRVAAHDDHPRDHAAARRREHRPGARSRTEELRILVERGGEQGTIEAEEEQMIGGVLELGERRVHEVMVARVDIAALPVDAHAGRDRRDDRVARATRASRSTRTASTTSSACSTPRTCCPTSCGDDQPPPIRRLLRTPLFVPESMLVDDLLHSLQRRGSTSPSCSTSTAARPAS